MKESVTCRVRRAKRTRFGRILCRLLGDERGGVMMEYVILAVLIAAVVAVAVAFFGDTIVGMIHTAAVSATETKNDTEVNNAMGAARDDAARVNTEADKRSMDLGGAAAPEER